MFAEGQGGYVHLISEMELRGCTVCFEYVGRQSKVKVGYQDRDLVVIAIRGKVSGEYMRYSDMQSVCQRYGVSVVRRVGEELVGKGLGAVKEWVGRRGLERWEGVMVRLSSGVHVKVKTQWWKRGMAAVGKWRKGLELASRREVKSEW